MEESYARASESSEVDVSTNEETVTSCNFSSVETQTDSVKHDDRIVQTKITELCTKQVQTDREYSSFAESNFLSDDGKVRYYTGLPNSKILLWT